MANFEVFFKNYYSYYFTLNTIIVNNSHYWTGNLVSRKNKWKNGKKNYFFDLFFREINLGGQ